MSLSATPLLLLILSALCPHPHTDPCPIPPHFSSNPYSLLPDLSIHPVEQSGHSSWLLVGHADPILTEPVMAKEPST